MKNPALGSCRPCSFSVGSRRLEPLTSGLGTLRPELRLIGLETASPELFQAARAGDPQAFQESIGPHLAALRRLVFSLSSNWQDADDIAREAWIKAFRAFCSFDGRAALPTWPYTVARSASVDWHRIEPASGVRAEPVPQHSWAGGSHS